jgi:hypothetical protein
MLYRQSIEEHLYLLFGITQLIGGDSMSKIIKEPFAPRRCDPLINYRRESSRVSRLSFGLQLRKLAIASSEDICMIVLLVALLVTTLLLPWIVL